MLGLARAQFALDDAAGCRNTLDQLIQHNPQYRSSEGHLLYARALTRLGELAKAEEEYHALLGHFAGPEARYHYAQLLRQAGRERDARAQLEQIEQYARRAPKHYRNLHQACLAQVRDELKALDAPQQQNA